MSEVNKELSKIVGSRIKELRAKRGMSQADLAAKANISVPHMSSIELGKTQMMLPMFVRLLEALDVSADYLYQSEFAELLSDCTPQEMEAILQIVKQLKNTMHQKTEN